MKNILFIFFEREIISFIDNREDPMAFFPYPATLVPLVWPDIVCFGVRTVSGF